MFDPALRRILKTDPAAFRPYDRYGEPIPGLTWVPLSGELHDGEFECFLLRMAAGTGSRPHEHTGIEEFLVLEGELIDYDGTRFAAGDFVHFEPGSKHASHTPDGCMLLVMLRGRNRPLEETEIAALSAE